MTGLNRARLVLAGYAGRRGNGCLTGSQRKPAPISTRARPSPISPPPHRAAAMTFTAGWLRNSCRSICPARPSC